MRNDGSIQTWRSSNSTARAEAVVEHSTVGSVKVYVPGNAYGTFHAPGRTTVTLSGRSHLSLLNGLSQAGSRRNGNVDPPVEGR